MARRQATIFINGKEIRNEIASITAEKRNINREIRHMTVGSEEYNKAVKKLSGLNGTLTTHRKNVSGISTSYDKTSSSVKKLGGIAAAAFSAQVIIGYGVQLFKLGVEMDQLDRKARTVFAETLPFATKQATENANAMGLTTTQYINQAAAMQDLLVPLGFQRQKAAELATTTTNLSGVLSEWSAGQFTAAEANERLRKGVQGQLEPLEALGIKMIKSDVTARLAEKGLTGLTGQLLKQAEAAATLELIMEKSADAQESYAANGDSMIRTVAEMKAQFTEVSEKLATALIPVFSKLLDVAGMVADGLISISSTFADMLDPIQGAANAFDDQSAKVADLEANLAPLLDRYDELVASDAPEAQEELKKVIEKIADITPSAITQVDKYGKVLGINAQQSREFLNAERARLQFVNQESIASIEKETLKIEDRRIKLQQLIETGKVFVRVATNGDAIMRTLSDGDINDKRAELAKINQTLIGAEQELARLRGTGGVSPDGVATPATSTVSSTKRTKASDKEAQRQRKAAEKALAQQEAAQQKSIESLEKFLDKEANERLLASVTKREADHLRIEDEFAAKQAQIEQLKLTENERAIELEAQLAIEKRAAHDLLEEQFKVEDDEAKLIAKEEIDLAVATEAESEIIRIQTHYAALMELAQTHGFDMSGLIARQEQDIAAIKKKHQEEDQKRDKAAKADQVERDVAAAEAKAKIQHAEIGMFREGAAILSTLAGDNAALQDALFLFNKGLAAADVIINLQKERAVIFSTLGGPLSPVAIAAATKATIRAGLSIGQIAATSIAKFRTPQKKEGGWHDVQGAQDGASYNAKYIGRPQSGLLPTHPSLVLASERGPEYFVSNEDMRNPPVANLVRMIDNITKGGVTQYMDGGATGDISETGGSGGSASDESAGSTAIADPQLAQEISRLSSILEGGVFAIIGDQTIVDLTHRLEVLKSAAGGSLPVQ